jgi:hypothetical protein
MGVRTMQMERTLGPARFATNVVLSESNVGDAPLTRCTKILLQLDCAFSAVILGPLISHALSVTTSIAHTLCKEIRLTIPPSVSNVKTSIMISVYVRAAATPEQWDIIVIGVALQMERTLVAVRVVMNLVSLVNDVINAAQPKCTKTGLRLEGARPAVTLGSKISDVLFVET